VKNYLISIIFSLISLNSFGSSIENYSLSIDEFAIAQQIKRSQLKILVKSISTTDKALFPGIGKVFLVTEPQSENFNVRGLLVKTPVDYNELIYIPLSLLNKGKTLNILFAKKYGVRLSVLKMKLSNSKKVSAEDGGVVTMKILKNGLLKKFHSFKLKLTRVQGEWEALVRNKRKFERFKTIHLLASKVGVKKVEFK
jgi:hypothetical protein